MVAYVRYKFMSGSHNSPDVGRKFKEADIMLHEVIQRFKDSALLPQQLKVAPLHIFKYGLIMIIFKGKIKEMESYFLQGSWSYHFWSQF